MKPSGATSAVRYATCDLRLETGVIELWHGGRRLGCYDQITDVEAFLDRHPGQRVVLNFWINRDFDLDGGSSLEATGAVAAESTGGVTRFYCLEGKHD